MKHLATMAIVCFSLLYWPGVALANPDLLPPGKWWKLKGTRLANEIKLSESQAQQLDQIFNQHRKKLIDLKADLEKKEVDLEALLEADRLDEKAIVEQVNITESARSALAKSSALMMIKMRQVLTPEQWKKTRLLEEERIRRFFPPLPEPPPPPFPHPKPPGH
ncbi:MAG: periplasmic heavy metal sensor [Acidobacteria bacterium]|nr:periplasmic heavy metal sensor [Acidobacteriota bacterium]